MTKKQKIALYRIIAAAVILIPLLVLEYTGVLENLSPFLLVPIFLVPYAIIGYDIFLKAFEHLKHGQVFDENFLMIIATIAAFAVGEYAQAVAVMLLYQIGELFQSCAVGKSRKSIAAMMDIVPEYANIEEDGQLTQVDPDEVPLDSVIVILPGERIPLDGIVLQGESLIDTSALTGESVPRRAAVGDEVISGCVNGSGTLKLRVTKAFEDSTVTRILELVENASSRKAQVENFITRFARVYTPVVTGFAVLLAVIPPLFFGQPFSEWLQRACIFLVVSCPCALVISVPMGFFGGIGAASRIGVLVKGSNYLEVASHIDTVVFDKTGTLTKGEFKVSRVLPASGSEADLLQLAALGEGYSTHPIAASVREAYTGTLDLNRVSESENLSGRGIRAVIDGSTVLLGNAKLMNENHIAFTETATAGTILYIAKDSQYLGCIVISDSLKPGAKEAIASMSAAGVRNTVMLTGDRLSAAQGVANELGLSKVYADLLPQDKVTRVEELLQAEPEGGKLAFVGDGINDAPVLSRADIGFAMGSMGSDAAIEAADIVIMDDDPRKITSTIVIARKTLRIVRQNIIFALAVKLIIMILGVFGLANMWLAVIGDVGVSIIAILNSMRTLRQGR